jgi:phospholipid transport system transporter-binding protein
MKLPEHATLEQAASLAATLPADIAAGSGALQVDASALNAFDSSTIALLLHARRLAQAAGREFSVSGAPEQLGQLARLYGVEELLSLSNPRSADT